MAPTARTLWTALLLLGTALAGTGCSDLAEASPLAHARTSPEALARAAVQAVVSEDAEALAALMITREEYQELLWPVLPDREQMPFDFVWSITGPRSRNARVAVMKEYGGLPLELVRVELGDDREEYAEFTLHPGARMVVRRTDTDVTGTFPLMDTLVEMEGGWKFMNFVDDA